MDRIISLSKTYQEDAEEMREILTLFSSEGKRDAQIIRVGIRKTAQELAFEGMAMAEAGADSVCPGWGDMALDTVRRFCMEHPTAAFRAEIIRIWAKDIIPVRSLRAWGPVMLRAAKMGIVKAVGYEKTTNPLAHATPATLWAVV